MSLLLFRDTPGVADTEPIPAWGMAVLLLAGVAAATLGVALSRRFSTQALRKCLIFCLMVPAARLLLSA